MVQLGVLNITLGYDKKYTCTITVGLIFLELMDLKSQEFRTLLTDTFKHFDSSKLHILIT